MGEALGFFHFKEGFGRAVLAGMGESTMMYVYLSFMRRDSGSVALAKKCWNRRYIPTCIYLDEGFRMYILFLNTNTV